MTLISHSGPAPEGNTGAIPTKPKLEALIDWLQGTFPGSNFNKVQRVVASAFCDSFAEQPFGTRFYERSFKSAVGALMASMPRKGGKIQQRDDAYLEFSGQVLGRLPAPRLHRLMVSLQALGFKASRIDLTLDDYAKSFRPKDAYDSYLAGHVVGFRGTGKWFVSGKPDELCQTFSLGNRGKVGGGKFIQFYDKFLESKGVKDCVRVELSFYGERARAAFDSLCTVGYENWPDLIPSYIAGAVDFRNRNQSDNISRCDRVEWWAAIIGAFQGIKLSKPKILKTFERMSKWLRKQVSPTLATVYNAVALDSSPQVASDFLLSLLLDGEIRMNEDHLAILRQVKQSVNFRAVTS